MKKVFAKYNIESMEVEGFFLEEQIQPDFNYIEITQDKEIELREMCNENCGTLFLVNVETKEFESRVISLENIPLSKEEKAIKDLEEENLQLKVALAEMTEEKDSQILEIQLALAEIVEGGLI
ncbi:hypothetical protein [Clostridium sp.]|uniref:hypothetical protein n=1 Tax=Clostridium sp. TaxID=1506 RepID=UPI0029032F1B|nr:hypothetical protein [Clostridium sp.]MDU2108965.1 hypothetical protein [Clostridium sp.]MDU3356010.1 hypothetical protein [Clostridium sp.]MDU6047114.1 hypothetical protein [Clostridium sp.]MDU6220588.1 hypothetical protein [Clostridium sp.]MDU6270929.1 hypothetical protein [Clostridium sp.]